MAQHPCGICKVHVLDTDEAIQCDGKCSLWHHRECLGMTLDVYLKLSKGQDDWVCRKCIIKQEVKQESETPDRQRIRTFKMGKTKVECKKLEFFTEKQKCVFCHTREMDEMKYGAVYLYRNIITHYYCLLLSSNMEQNGRDSDGILGFLTNDINKEVKRGMRLYCTFCRTGGATLGCAVAKCKVVFHLPCGLKHSTLHQFFGEFKSFCAKHRPVQKISEKILAESSKGAMCGICYEKVVPRPIHETLWAPCCQKSAFFHRDCVQKLATSAGYFFKCPLCNNTKEFQEAMKEYGIFIPEQDASWESVPQAYEELLVRHETCDSAKCICPSGRRTNVQGTRWELILCKFCGSQGIHIGCGRLKWKSPSFECDICSGTSPEEQESNTRNYNGNRHRLSGTGRTADIHPSVSADREAEGADSDSSDDSTRVTITNSNRKLLCPGIESRISTPPPEKQSKQNKTERKSASSTIVVDDIRKTKPSTSIVIDDSDDDDIEVVSVSKSDSGCLKTLAGLTIPIIHFKETHKRPRAEGDVKVLPDEIVDITIQMQNPSKKAKSVSPPPIEEVVYSLPTPQPSTSAAYSAPSTSFAPPPDFGRFVLVDPNNLRPEDLPPGTMLYRSVQPALNVPQIQVQPQLQPQMQSQIPSNVPMQQLGSSSHADAKHPNLSKHRSRNVDYIRTQHLPDCTKKSSRSVKCDCPRRRRRRLCDNNRLNPKVMLSPLKCRISNGYYEILFARRNLGFSSMKRKAPLPPRPMKKIKVSHESNYQSTYKSSKTYQKKIRKPKILVCKQINLKSDITEFTNKIKENKTLDTPDNTNHVKNKNLSMKNLFSSQKLKICFEEQKKQITNSMNIHDLKTLHLDGKEPVKICKDKLVQNCSPENKVIKKEKRKKPVLKFEEWKYKKIDFYLKKINSSTISQTETDQSAGKEDSNQQNQSNSLSDHGDEKNITVKSITDGIIDLVFKEDTKLHHLEDTNVLSHSDNGEDLSSSLNISSDNSDVGNAIKNELAANECDMSEDLEPEGINNQLKISENTYSEDSINNSSLKSDSLISDSSIASNIALPLNKCDLPKDIELEGGNEELKTIMEHSILSDDDTKSLLCNDLVPGFLFEDSVKKELADEEFGVKEKNEFSHDQVSSKEKLDNAQDNSGRHKSSSDSYPNILELNNDCRKSLKHSHIMPGKQIHGFFPKIRLAHRSKHIKRKNVNILKIAAKSKYEIKLNNLKVGEVIQVIPKQKTNYHKKNCFTNKRSVIDSYFMSVKKDALHGPIPISENQVTIDSSENKTFFINDVPVGTIECRNISKSNSPEKKPLAELHCNMILN